MIDKLAKQIAEIIPQNKLRYVRSEIVKSDKSITVYFNSSIAVSDVETKQISSLVKSYLPQSFNDVKIVINKIIVLEEFVKKEIVKYLSDNHKISCSSVVENDISAKIAERVQVLIKLESTVYQFFKSENVAEEIKTHLENIFVNDFIIETEDIGQAKVDTEKLKYIPKESEMQIAFRRELKVKGVTKLFDDDDTDTATYIADCRGLIGECHLAGTITNIREQESKAGKPFYIVEFSDKTGQASGVVFPNKDKLPKLKKLSAGVDIIIRGEYEMRGEYHNLRILSINLCEFPKNFIPQERPKKPCPKEYSLIFPKELVIETQASFVDVKETPKALLGRNFVVFDFETTGTDFDDKITEIGAVKMVDGKIIEYFSTLVNPGKHIPNEVVNLTGIDDNMVADAPTFADVCADFYKFCYGSTLIAHNIEFDSRFLRNESKPLDYDFDNPQLDTLALARECIYGVANYKLNTLCDKFGITFRHHRAYADALATGELFIEIIRIRKKI